MPTFTLGGTSLEYLTPMPDVELHDIHSWEYGHWPRVEADIPLSGGVTAKVYAEASRWGGSFIRVRWLADAGAYHQAWIPEQNVRRLTPSEWDIIEYHHCPENLRPVRWGKRLPGFLPEQVRVRGN